MGALTLKSVAGLAPLDVPAGEQRPAVPGRVATDRGIKGGEVARAHACEVLRSTLPS